MRVALSVAALCLCATAVLLAPRHVRGFAADELPRGTLIESVNVEAAPGQSYALYLPTGYTPGKRWPILYAFDPGGRGQTPVALFRAAAERYGYVVAGSNDSRNGLAPAAVVAIINALWKDTHARLSIDDARIYATGFSGGARVANRLAAGCGGCVAGVIASGAGFPPDIAPTAKLTYAFFGTVGVDDFNFREMRPLERTLDALGISNRLVTFDGRHQWCPEAVCAEGLEWMELLAMRRGRRPKDNALIDAALARLSAQAESLKRPEDAYERYALLKVMATTFDGLRDVARYRAEAAALKGTKELRAAIAEEERQIGEEQKRAREVVALGDGLMMDDEAHDDALAGVRKRLAPWREQAKAAEDSAARRVARRTLAHIFAEAFESALFLYEPQKKFKLAVANLELATEVFPTAPGAEYELARALALDGHKDKTLDALTRAVEKGYRDAVEAEREEAFAPLRANTRFKKLLGRMAEETPSGAKTTTTREKN